MIRGEGRRCTQGEIAARVHMDVSSVSKILNRTPGSVFRPETIRRVFSAARELGYDFNRGRAGMAKNALKEILTGGHLVRMSAAKIKVYRKIAGL